MEETKLPPNLAAKRMTNRELVAKKIRRSGAGDARWPGMELIALSKAIAKLVASQGATSDFARKCGLPESTVRQAMDPRICNPRLSTLLVMARAARHKVALNPKG